jgi:hypothetical protein
MPGWASRAATFSKIVLTDARNRLRYGLGCPVRFQLEWVDPLSIRYSTRYFPIRPRQYLLLGQDLDHLEILAERARFVSPGDWDLAVSPIDQVGAVARFKDRLATGRSWEEVGEIPWMMANIEGRGLQDGCRSLADVTDRCNRLDSLHEVWKLAGGVLTQRQLDPLRFREMGGVGVAIGRSGDLIWMDGGAHRLALAQHLRLPRMPVCLVLVHERAVREGLVRRHLL